MQKFSRATALALTLFLALAAAVTPARADDNWLVGKWQTSNGISVTFTATTYSMDGPGGSIGPYKCTYSVGDGTVTITPTEGDDKSPMTVKKVDDTHATMPLGDDTVTLTKQ